MVFKFKNMFFSALFFYFSYFSSHKSIKANDLCNEDCLSKTYCISSDGSEICSRNNMVTAKFTVIEKSTLNEYLQLTVTGYNIEPKETKTIELELKESSGLSTAYSCYKPSSGSTSCKVVKDGVDHVTGTSSYSNDVLSCTWVFHYEDDIWPSIHKKPVDLINDDSLSIVLKYGSKKMTVAQDTSELPIYKVKFLKCCHKVHGNENYVLTFKQGENVEYFLQVTSTVAPPTSASVILIDPSGVEIMFTCYFDAGYLSANILAHGNATASVTKQLFQQQLSESRCTWATPLVISSEAGGINTTNTPFDLQVVADDIVVYSEHGVYLGDSSASSLKTSFTIIITLIATVLCKTYHFNQI